MLFILWQYRRSVAFGSIYIGSNFFGLRSVNITQVAAGGRVGCAVFQP